MVAGAQRVPRRAAAGPLKILVAVGAPDEGKSDQAVLDLERELQGILDAVEAASRLGNAQVRFLEVGHPDEIERALIADEYHVLHLSGHGKPGAIALENEDGGEVDVTAEELAERLKRAGRSLPLVFLSSCHGGTASSETVGMATGLVRAGIPLVLSMQTRVTDLYASKLAEAFYADLATAETPLASRALARARQKLEEERRKAVERGAPLSQTEPEYAAASLFGSGTETPLIDRGLDLVSLSRPPVHKVTGPVPQLTIGELVGRRRDLRQVMRVLRDDPRSVKAIGHRAGVVVTGIGGIGKSSVAGRTMVRMSEEGWIVAASSGRFSLGDIARALAFGLMERNKLNGIWAQLANAQLDDSWRVELIKALLQRERVLLVLDNFEDNLKVGGGAFLDPMTKTWLWLFARSAKSAKLLITSRYPLPGGADYFETRQLGPLSPAETRKLVLRLEGLEGISTENLAEVQRRIGGHPRLLEYLDGILRAGKARFPEVVERLRSQATEAGISLERGVGDLSGAMRDAAMIGARDVLLDELLAIATENGDAETLLQCAVSSLPIDAAGVAHALSDSETTPEVVGKTEASLERLVDLSLVTDLDTGLFWVHRWTAKALAERSPVEHRARCARAGRYRVWRMRNIVDAMEATRNFLDGQEFDDASTVAFGVANALVRFDQSAAAAAFAAEVGQRLPETNNNFAALADIEASSILALGFTDRALKRYERLLALEERRVKAEPERADYQRDLSISHERLGDLMSALGQGEQAREFYQKALAISERLAKAEPERADYQRDLSVSHERLGGLMSALGQGEQAREFYQKALAISERLAKAEPERADYQRDLSVSYNKLGTVMSALGQGEQAREFYQKALAIRERLAKAEPERADYQRDLLVSLLRIMQVAPERADAAIAQGQAILRQLEERGVMIEQQDDIRRLFELEPSAASRIQEGESQWQEHP